MVAATEEEAAEAYDIAAIKFRGANAVTNFEMNRYDVEAIAKSSLPIGGAAKRLKLSLESEQKPVITHNQQPQSSSGSNSSINFAAIQSLPAIPCGIPIDASTAALYHHNLFQHFQSNNLITTSNSPGSSSIATPMNIYHHPQAEYFLWPHQPYWQRDPMLITSLIVPNFQPINNTRKQALVVAFFRSWPTSDPLTVILSLIHLLTWEKRKGRRFFVLMAKVLVTVARKSGFCN